MESTGKPGWLAGAITGIAMSGVINSVILAMCCLALRLELEVSFFSR